MKKKAKKTIVAKKTAKKPSPAQIAARLRFAEAARARAKGASKPISSAAKKAPKKATTKKKPAKQKSASKPVAARAQRKLIALY